jgi:hypothetical protein
MTSPCCRRGSAPLSLTLRSPGYPRSLRKSVPSIHPISCYFFFFFSVSGYTALHPCLCQRDARICHVLFDRRLNQGVSHTGSTMTRRKGIFPSQSFKTIVHLSFSPRIAEEAICLCLLSLGTRHPHPQLRLRLRMYRRAQ